jgi:peptidoglycan/LPS O-acetylase OafA/YrhL
MASTPLLGSHRCQKVYSMQRRTLLLTGAGVAIAWSVVAFTVYLFQNSLGIALTLDRVIMPAAVGALMIVAARTASGAPVDEDPQVRTTKIAIAGAVFAMVVVMMVVGFFTGLSAGPE